MDNAEITGLPVSADAFVVASRIASRFAPDAKMDNRLGQIMVDGAKAIDALIAKAVEQDRQSRAHPAQSAAEAKVVEAAVRHERARAAVLHYLNAAAPDDRTPMIDPAFTPLRAEKDAANAEFVAAVRALLASREKTP